MTAAPASARRKSDRPTRGSAFVAASRARDGHTRAGRRLGSITTRILVLNVLALAVLVGGLLYLDQFRAGLIEAKIQALTTEGEIIAGALGETATDTSGLPQALDPASTRQLLRRLIEPTAERARVFVPSGALIADSRILEAAGRDVHFEFLPPQEELSVFETAYEAAAGALRRVFGPRLPRYVERRTQTAGDYPSVQRALTGEIASSLRLADDGVIVTVAVPIQSFKQVLGALMLSADTEDIEDGVRQFRLDVLQVSGIAFAITVLLSLYLAGTIARPVTRLAAAAKRVRGMRGRDVEIPDFTARFDEIGDLSGALRDMTAALYQRLDAIEMFAADVAHEIKNPLTSLRSAVEALDKAKDERQRRQLFDIIRDDVGRIDRLISDISDASRLDAELSRSRMETVDMRRLLEAIVEIHSATDKRGAARIDLRVEDGGDYCVRGIEDRLGQVMRNLISNARSFSPPDGTITLTLSSAEEAVRIVCDDEGPGFPAENMDRVFERFYTHRPQGEAFGKHSGLGLSISRQIVEAHAGTIAVSNRSGAAGEVRGGRVTIDLPRAGRAVDTP